MRSRWSVPRAAKHLVISTFHSLGVRILRSEYGEKLGLKQQFSILDSDDVLGILKEAGATQRQRARTQAGNGAISGWKSEGRHSGTSPKPPRGAKARPTSIVAAARDAALRGTPRGLPGRRFRRPHQPAAEALAARRRSAREVAGARFRYVLVDEYQDTNAIQYEMLKSLVGDPDDGTARCSPRWATTTRASTAGAARPSTT